jgi:hypothetical protein
MEKKLSGEGNNLQILLSYVREKQRKGRYEGYALAPLYSFKNYSPQCSMEDLSHQTW